MGRITRWARGLADGATPATFTPQVGLRRWRNPRACALDGMLGLLIGWVVVIGAAAPWVPRTPGTRPFDATGVALVVVLALAVGSRRCLPRVAFVLAEAATLAWLLLGYDRHELVVLVPAVMAYTITVVYGGRWGAAAGAVHAVMGAAVIVAGWEQSGLLEGVGFGVSFGGIAAVATGLAVRYYRAYTGMLRAQVARAEQEREEEARRRVDAERLRIARELHDVVSHGIATISVQAGTALHGLDRLPALPPEAREAREALVAIRQASGESMRELRTMLGILRRGGDEQHDAPDLTPAPGLAQVEDLAAAVRAAGVEVEVGVTGQVSQLPASVQLAAYRVVQEALTNTLRHADAGRAAVTLEATREQLEVVVTDDGRGTGTATSGGHGIAGMRERTQALGGELHAGPAASGRGFEVRCRLPVQSPPGAWPAATRESATA